MLGRRDAQRNLFEADTQYLGTVGRESCYGFLASLRGELFHDEEFASFYDSAGRGRPSVPPSLLATALLLQTYDRVSDEEATARAAFDLRWKVALGIPIEQRPFAKSTLQLFRAQLVVHEEGAAIFRRSLSLARQRGFVGRNRKLRVALDTTNILGRGAVKDTYNLLGDGIVLVLRQCARLAGAELGAYAAARGLRRYVGARSLKGEVELDWDKAAERTRLLREIVADADRLLEHVRTVRGGLDAGSAQDEALCQAAQRLSTVLWQDIERSAQGAQIREGVAKDRMPAIHDPEQRHGRKSARKRFDGHKAQIAVDTETQLITAVTVLPGNAPDHDGALAMVEETERNTEAAVGETVADCAYGDGATRRQFVDAGRRLVARVPVTRNGDCFPKTDFVIDMAAETCVCPAGVQGEAHYGRLSAQHPERILRGFRFAAAQCAACPLRPQCVRGRGGRSIAIHPEEALLQEARAFQHSPDFGPYKRARQVVEHRLARLVQLGLRQARYCGRVKTYFQLLMAATVANLTLLAAQSPATAGGSDPSGRLFLVLIALCSFVSSQIRARTNSTARFASGIPSLFPALSLAPPPLQMACSRPHF